MGKVHLFLRYVDCNERMKLDNQLEDDNGANHLIEEWGEVKRVCQQNDKRKMNILSSTTNLLIHFG